MSSSDDDEVAILWWQLRSRKRKRKFWKKPSAIELERYSASLIAKEVKAHPTAFKNCYRMSPNSFEVLLNLISPQITKQDTNFREAINPTEKLLITLRYLGTGCSFMALSHLFMRGDNTIGLIVKECSTAIWQSLQPLYMPVPTESMWKLIAKRYYEFWDLPNCIGSIDGKHCRINKFYKTGLLHYNYKGYFSIVLMACADADGIFTTIDVGEAGRNSDGAVFRNCTLGKLLDKEKLHIPKSAPMPYDENEFPFYFVEDQAFPLKKNLMRPFPQRTLDNEQRIFNYRISRGRKSVECAFGMLVSKFHIFQRPILCQEATAIAVIKAACVLHNFIKTTEGKFSTAQILKEDNSTFHIKSSDNLENKTTNKSANELRNYLKAYFLKPENTLPWQHNYTV